MWIFTYFVDTAGIIIKYVFYKPYKKKKKKEELNIVYSIHLKPSLTLSTLVTLNTQK